MYAATRLGIASKRPAHHLPEPDEHQRDQHEEEPGDHLDRDDELRRVVRRAVSVPKKICCGDSCPPTSIVTLAESW